MRPKRWWDSKQARDKYARIEAAIDAWHDPDGQITVCPCHGRRLIWTSWAGLTKRGKR